MAELDNFWESWLAAALGPNRQYLPRLDARSCKTGGNSNSSEVGDACKRTHASGITPQVSSNPVSAGNVHTHLGSEMSDLNFDFPNYILE